MATPPKGAFGLHPPPLLCFITRPKPAPETCGRYFPPLLCWVFCRWRLAFLVAFDHSRPRRFACNGDIGNRRNQTTRSNTDPLSPSAFALQPYLSAHGGGSILVPPHISRIGRQSTTVCSVAGPAQTAQARLQPDGRPPTRPRCIHHLPISPIVYAHHSCVLTPPAGATETCHACSRNLPRLAACSSSLSYAPRSSIANGDPTRTPAHPPPARPSLRIQSFRKPDFEVEDDGRVRKRPLYDPSLGFGS